MKDAPKAHAAGLSFEAPRWETGWFILLVLWVNPDQAQRQALPPEAQFHTEPNSVFKFVQNRLPICIFLNWH